MNICIYSANFLPNIGGIEKFTDRLSAQLVNMGHHVTIVTNNVFGLRNKETLISGAEIYRLPCHPLFQGRLPLPKQSCEFRSLLDEIFNMPTDSVIINARFYPHSLIGIKHAEAKDIKPIVIDHGSAYITFGNPAIDIAVKAYEHLITSLLRRHKADYYGISSASLQWLQTFHINGIGVINNSIDADEYLNAASSRNFASELGLEEGCFLVSFTGRFIPEKGVDELLGAARMLKSQNVAFLLAGGGPLEAKLAAQNPGNIYLLGKLSSEDIAALLKQSDAFCLPTRSEGFSTSLLEAAACNTAPIITNVGGVPELIPSEEFGTILPSQAPEAIASSVLDFMHDPRKKESQAKNIGSRVRESFSWEKTAEKVIAACHKANPDLN